MQSLNRISLVRGARTNIVIDRYRQDNITCAARMALFLNKSKRLATKTNDHGHVATELPRDKTKEIANDKGNHKKIELLSVDYRWVRSLTRC